MDFFSSVCAGDVSAAIRNNEDTLAPEYRLEPQQAGAYRVSFGCWIHLRNHLSAWLCLTAPRTDCDRSCCLAQRGQTFPYWCSGIRDKKQLGGLGTESSEQNTFNPLEREMSGSLLCCTDSESSPQCANHWFMLPTLVHKKHCLKRNPSSSVLQPCIVICIWSFCTTSLCSVTI